MKERFDVSTLEQLSTPQLDAMLHAQLNAQQPDDHAVRLILRVLRAREADVPVQTNEKVHRAWKTYTRKTAAHSVSGKAVFRIAAVVALCLTVLLLLPQEAAAGNLFDRLISWTESFFQFFGREEPPMEYEFRTSHPGLQKLYDTVSAQGVTVPVVPMWLDEAFELEYYEVIETPTTTKLLAVFFNGEKEAVFEFNIYTDAIPREFHKNNPEEKPYEVDRIIHYVFKNNGQWIAAWENGNVECFVTVDCSERDIYRMIDSIYITEDSN